MKRSGIFEKCKVYWWPGYYVPVKNRWSEKIRKKHLTVSQKEAYEKVFGTRILYHDEFDNWIMQHQG